MEDTATNENERAGLTAEIKEKLDRYTLSIKNENPFLYYFSSRVKACKNFFVHSGTYNLFSKASFDLTKIQLLLKIFFSLLYLFVALFGFIGLLVLVWKGFSNPVFLLLSLCGFYTALAFPLLLKLDEYRYFVTAYPLFLIAGIFASMSIFGLLKNKFSNNA